MSEFRKVIHPADELIKYETVFEENPYIRTGVPTKKGTIERIDYTTSVYEDGKTYNKTCYVYLPYGYDKDDKSKKYNVLYFQHGNTCEPAQFAIGGNKPMFDMIFEDGTVEPCIIAFITYYFDPLGDAEHRTFGGRSPAGDGGWLGTKPLYHREIVENIIPEVELRYNTYLTDASEEAVKASRDHRAFSGYSRGCVCTWRMLHHCLEHFRWFAPMSCWTMGDYPHQQIGSNMPKDEVVDYVTAGIKAHPELPFYIFASNGGPEDTQAMTTQVNWILEDPVFSYGKDPSKNNFYFSVSDFYHTDFLVPYYYYNSLKVLFKGV